MPSKSLVGKREEARRRRRGECWRYVGGDFPFDTYSSRSVWDIVHFFWQSFLSPEEPTLSEIWRAVPI
jgi:hypothetical protein